MEDKQVRASVLQYPLTHEALKQRGQNMLGAEYSKLYDLAFECLHDLERLLNWYEALLVTLADEREERAKKEEETTDGTV